MIEEIHTKLRNRWGELGFDYLEDVEKEAIALFWLEAEVMNGGLHQYFWNFSRDLYPFAVSGLKRINALESLEPLQIAAAKMGDIYPLDRWLRTETLEKLGMDGDPFDSETNLLQDLPEHFFDMSLETLPLLLKELYESE